MIQGIFVRLPEAILLSPFLTVKESGISGSFKNFYFGRTPCTPGKGFDISFRL